MSRGNIGSVYGFKVYNDRSTFYSALAAFTSDGDSAAYLADLSFSESGEIEVGFPVAVAGRGGVGEGVYSLSCMAAVV